MSEAFDKCVSEGGLVRMKTTPDGKYQHICYHDGKAYPTEVKVREEKKEEKK